MATNPISSTIVTRLPTEIHYLIITQILMDWYQPANGPPIAILTHDALHTLYSLGLASRFYRDLTTEFFKQATTYSYITNAIQSLPIYTDYHMAIEALLKGNHMTLGKRNNQRTIVHEIIDSNCSTCLGVLLRNGLPGTSVDTMGNSFLALAIMSRNTRILRTLAAHVPPEAILMPSPAFTEDGHFQEAESDLWIATIMGDIDVFDILYSKIEGNVGGIVADIFTPYDKANLCRFVSTDMAQRLLNDGVNIADFRISGCGHNEWHCAVMHNRGHEFLDWVFKHSKRSVDNSDRYGETALNDAVRGRRTAVVKWLLKRGARPERANKKGIPPFWHVLKDIRQPASLRRLRRMLRYIRIVNIPHSRTLTDYVWLALRVGHRLIAEDQTLNKDDAKREREAINQRAFDMVSLIEAPQVRGRKIVDDLNSRRPEDIDGYIEQLYKQPNNWGRNGYFNKLTAIIRGETRYRHRQKMESYLLC